MKKRVFVKPPLRAQERNGIRYQVQLVVDRKPQFLYISPPIKEFLVWFNGPYGGS
jgi:hypothetical protein